MYNGFHWNTSYIWRLRPINTLGDFGEWSNIGVFYIKPLPPEISSFDVSIYDSSSYNEGITIMDQLGDGIIYAIDISGSPIWFVQSNIVWSNGFSYLVQFTHFLPSGNFIGIAEMRENNLPARAFEMAIDNTLIWEGPGELNLFGVHHDVFPMPNGNILALTIEEKLFPIPDEVKVPENYAFVDSLPWQGDRIVEWDSFGNEVWSWSVFDHFDRADWNQTDYEFLFIHSNPADFFYDWTHSNAVWYDELENVIYLSVRNLSRITIINYSTGEIIWNMGKDMPSGDVTVGTDLEFSGQHSVKILDNRNIMIYDNGIGNNQFISRGLEISISESDQIPEAEIFWEYFLGEGLGSGLMSDCDRLSNGNSLLTSTTVNYILEVSPDNEIVWEILPNQDGSTYRSERVPGLYRHAFTVIQPNFIDGENGPTLTSIPGEISLNYRLINEGRERETFHYSLTDELGWFSDSGSVEINSEEDTIIFLSGIVPNYAASTTLSFALAPEIAPQLVKTFSLILESSLSIKTPQSSDTFSINSIYPNPFNMATTIQYTLPSARTMSSTSLQIFDITGNLVATLVNKNLSPGDQTITWNADRHSSGVYFLKMELENYLQVKKIMLIK